MSGPRSIRGVLATDTQLGAGNVIERLLDHGVEHDEPTLTFDTRTDAQPAWQTLSLGELDRCIARRAGWLHAHGIGRRDVVAVCSAHAPDYVLTFFAANRLGAIPAFVNNRLDEGTGVAYLRHIKPTAILADPAHRTVWSPYDLGASRLYAVEDLADEHPEAQIPPYRHRADDPVVLTHSSGTTGMPKAVISTHASLFAGLRHWLRRPRAQGSERMLSVLPMHNSMLAAVLSALCNRSQFLQLSSQSGRRALEAIERWRPSGVYGFPGTWVEILALSPSHDQLRSVRAWWNTGDSAHEAHIRRLIGFGRHDEATSRGRRTVDGSSFVDGFGSSEMGHSQFSIIHRPDTDHYNRCIGRPHSFAEVRVLGGDGIPVPDGSVGQLAVRSPTLFAGYWNDSARSYRSHHDGFYLTGDFGYRDGAGYYYHVDRTADAIQTATGTRIYTTLVEEQILARCPGLLDCTVVASDVDGEPHTEILLTLRPEAQCDPELDYETHILGLLDAAVARTVKNVRIAGSRIPTGATGKVRKFQLRV
ncbi:fatty-acyl-CoA synthase [Streptomyces albospinus]|uniref:Fatty-acyl-CoA synthase n=1 Tax=Streptomyces albospinus TaxID=285515 RepID=A0ABQ2V436_9ACTN|nr:class I adenylate-forming enzyme family protein [Streptomyces albospinus]GGU65167.1 fatty-acyl-CoA synthase [Streptomyces albospinus]